MSKKSIVRMRVNMEKTCLEINHVLNALRIRQENVMPRYTSDPYSHNHPEICEEFKPKFKN